MWRVRFSAYAPLAVWIGVIFFFSSGFGSAEHTSRFVRPLLEFLFPGASPETISFYHAIIRKSAHFAEYFVLGLLAVRAARLSTSEAVRRKTFLVSVIFVAAIAISDETLQSFNPSRTGAWLDVLIDLCGGLTGIVVFMLLNERSERYQQPRSRPSVNQP